MDSLSSLLAKYQTDDTKPNPMSLDEREFVRTATFAQMQERYGLARWGDAYEPLTPPVEDSATEPLKGRSGVEAIDANLIQSFYRGEEDVTVLNSDQLWSLHDGRHYLTTDRGQEIRNEMDKRGLL